jgi:hypothetical protein
MTDHYLNSDLCSGCHMRRLCMAIVPDGTWNPYVVPVNAPGCCPAVIVKKVR